MRKQRLLRGLLWGLLWALLTGGCGRAGQADSVPVNEGTAALAEEDTDVTDVSGESTAGKRRRQKTRKPPRRIFTNMILHWLLPGISTWEMTGVRWTTTGNRRTGSADVSIRS